MPIDRSKLDRRRFLKHAAAGLSAATVGPSVLQAAEAGTSQPAADQTKVDPKSLIWRNKVAGTEYRRLGRTNFMVSRMVAGWLRNKSMWRRVLARGVNYFDHARGYGEYEVEAKDFLKKNRDKIWITSKSTNIAGFRRVDPQVDKLYRQAIKDYLGDDEGKLINLHEKAIEKQKKTGKKPDLRPAGKLIAKLYLQMLDQSLSRMGIDHVDCYMMHGIEIPWIFDCLELWEAYQKAHQAGKIKHFGHSVHKHQQAVLAATVEANKRGPWKIDLVMPSVNPVTFDEWKTELAALKKQDVGIIAMKTTGVKSRPIEGVRKDKLKALGEIEQYNEYERKKLYMLHLTEDIIDACIAQINNNDEMEKNLALPSVKMSAAAERELRTIVKLEMAGACHLCGNCTAICPECIAVTDMIRYYAYIHQYNEKEMARELYALAGYDPAKVCTNCGKCENVCMSDVPITKLLHKLSADLA
ncbi:MAG: aldo/keto reductase [Planctomycetota bacterium]|nr:MAG: aldo/keto reductase [Planctomycetota bacterium]